MAVNHKRTDAQTEWGRNRAMIQGESRGVCSTVKMPFSTNLMVTMIPRQPTASTPNEVRGFCCLPASALYPSPSTHQLLPPDLHRRRGPCGHIRKGAQASRGGAGKRPRSHLAAAAGLGARRLRARRSPVGLEKRCGERGSFSGVGYEGKGKWEATTIAFLKLAACLHLGCRFHSVGARNKSDLQMVGCQGPALTAVLLRSVASVGRRAVGGPGPAVACAVRRGRGSRWSCIHDGGWGRDNVSTRRVPQRVTPCRAHRKQRVPGIHTN